MNEQGKELLTDPGITLHEEPWYWLCPLIVNEFASTAKDIDFRRSENQVFFVLARSLTGSEEKEIDWETVRRECKAAIVRIGAENEAPPTAQD